ncbi:FAD/NAD(P)-binding protein [Rhizobium sp. TH2]|uniref:FAD/NAD(P)-binding protein n=1 Tax=Rhizobium sp. TH2 TaxID=2775403 RepID=UPI0035BE5C96
MQKAVLNVAQVDARAVIAIIGGGFTGAAVAYHLGRDEGLDARVVVFEPREKVGMGVAYETLDPVHRINVPAAKMSLDPTEPEGFTQWITENDAVAGDEKVIWPDGSIYPRRRVFGDYVHAQVSPLIRSGRIEHVRTSVIRMEPIGGRWRIDTEDGSTVEADYVVIATSHPSPAAPKPLAAFLEGHPRFIADATKPDALKPVRPDDAVLVVGNGLTSADVIAALVDGGHKGPITAVSRRGLRSRGHAPKVQEAFGDFTARPIRSARLLSKRIREAIRDAAIFDLSWHAVIDAVRAQGLQIWTNLSIEERKRLVRHLRPFWDVHRFRIAPQIEASVDSAIASGQLEVLAASVGAVCYNGPKIRTVLRLAHQRGTLIRDFDAVVVTTGPAHGGIIESQPYLAGLSSAGLITADPARLGIACDDHALATSGSGEATSGLYIAGPLARGTFGELMGLPQVSEHAAFVASEVALAIVGARGESATDAA